MNYLCEILSPLLPCYSPPQPATILQDGFFRKQDWKCFEEEERREGEWKDEGGLPRVRKRYTSSPRATPAVQVFSPEVTPISIFLSYSRPSHFTQTLGLTEESLPEMLNYSRFVSHLPLTCSVFLSHL